MFYCLRSIALVLIFIGWAQDASSQQRLPDRVTSFVIGGVTLQEGVKNPIVPSGMQKVEITYNNPIMHSTGSLDIVAYPLEFTLSLYNAMRSPDAVISADRLTVTVDVFVPEGETYQMLIGRTEAEPVEERQQYFWGTVEVPDAVISGRAILPEGVTPITERSGGIAIVDPERYLKALESEYDFDLFQLAIVRIADFNEHLAFELEHVPDGAYAILAYQEVLDAQGNREDAGILLGMNVLTGGVDSTALIHVADGQSITDLQVMLQGEPEVVELSEVRIDSIYAEDHLFSVLRDNRQPTMIVDVSQALIVNIPKHIQDVFPVFLSGNVDDLLKFVIPVSDLMKGDIVSIVGAPVSGNTVQAALLIRHAKRSDLDRDGDVDFDDFLSFVGVYGTRDIFPGYVFEADLDGDGEVGFADFLIFVSDFEGG